MAQNLEFGRIGDGFIGSCGRPMCRICWQSHTVDVALESGDFAVMARLIDELLDAYCQESEEHNYCEAILDGSWPSAKTILEMALVKANEFGDSRESAK